MADDGHIEREMEAEACGATGCAPESWAEPIVRRKCEQLLDGARAVILARGFEGASVDEIAREAGISKATMYRYYPDKSALFAAVMQRNCSQQAFALRGVEVEGRHVGEILFDVGVRFVGYVLTPEALGMFRTAVAECQRFPAIGEAFFASGPDLGRACLVPVLTAAVERGEITVDDVDLAAHRFIVLCKAELFFNRLFGIVERYEDAQIEAHVGSAVAAFLRMYRPD